MILCKSLTGKITAYHPSRIFVKSAVFYTTSILHAKHSHSPDKQRQQQQQQQRQQQPDTFGKSEKYAKKELERHQVETIRFLNSKRPKLFSPDELARVYSISDQNIKRILDLKTGTLITYQLRERLDASTILDDMAMNTSVSLAGLVKHIEKRVKDTLEKVEQEYKMSKRINLNGKHRFLS